MAYNILIVDDSTIVRAMVKKTLAIAGVDVGEIFEAGDGREALDKLDANWVDVIFADINMPVMTGIELVDELASRNMLQATPVVIISTERSVTRIAELKAKGVSAYLNKPFTPEHLREVVSRVLGPTGLTEA
jgi:two-component system chemotaxis response regulator CheY